MQEMDQTITVDLLLLIAKLLEEGSEWGYGGGVHGSVINY
jgi:hypothetical protein